MLSLIGRLFIQEAAVACYQFGRFVFLPFGAGPDGGQPRLSVAPSRKGVMCLIRRCVLGSSGMFGFWLEVVVDI